MNYLGRNNKMGKYDGILICSDFDGTFASNSVIVPENAEAVRRFQAEGGMFTLSTGRSHHHFTSYKDIFHPNVPMLCYNGSVLYDPDSDQVLYEGNMIDGKRVTISKGMTSIQYGLADMREVPDISVSFMRLNAMSIATIVISFSLLSVANTSLYFSNFSFIKRAACR